MLNSTCSYDSHFIRELTSFFIIYTYSDISPALSSLFILLLYAPKTFICVERLY